MIALFSSFFVVAAISDLLHPEQTDTEVSVLWGLLFFFSLTLAAGLYLLLSYRKRKVRYLIERNERQLLQAIADANGRVTIAEIAYKTHMTLKESELALKALCKDGRGELQLTETGKMVYVFFGLLSEDEKNTAKSVMDY